MHHAMIHISIFFLFTYIYIFPPPLNLHKSLTAKQQSATPHPNHSKPIFMCAFVLVIPGLLFRYFYYHQTDSREKHRLKNFNLFSHSRVTHSHTNINLHSLIFNTTTSSVCSRSKQKETIKRHTHTHTYTKPMTTRQRGKNAHKHVQKRTTDVFGC